MEAVLNGLTSASEHLAEPTLVVIRGDIPPATALEDNEALARYATLQGPIPIARLPDPDQLAEAHSRLQREFPWAEAAVDALLGELRTRRLFGSLEMGIAPTLLVGAPGCGKSRLARRLAEELRVPFRALSFAGMNDSMPLLGTSRGWASGQASPLVELMMTRHTASALVLLDEIDKVGESTRHSVPPTVALLNLIEPENAKCWYDSYLQTACDLSKLMFLATANSLQPLSRPLLSRFRIVLVPEPRPCDFAAIARGAMRDIASEWGLPAETLDNLCSDLPVHRVSNAREVRSLVRTHLRSWAETRLGRPRLH
jgi:hypothetical protein